MSELTDDLKNRVMIGSHRAPTPVKNRLAHWIRQSLDILEQTPTGYGLLKGMPPHTTFRAYKMLDGSFGKAFARTYVGKGRICFSADLFRSFKQVVPAVAHECAHMKHFNETTAIRPAEQSVYEEFAFSYLDELGARLTERNMMREIMEKGLVSYPESFFQENHNFYKTDTPLEKIYCDVDTDYPTEFLKLAVQTGGFSEESDYLEKMKGYFKSAYPELTAQTHRHIARVFMQEMAVQLGKCPTVRLTAGEKRLLSSKLPKRVCQNLKRVQKTRG